MFLKYRTWVIWLFVVLSCFSGYYATQLKFSFSFEQFFPSGDPDLEFYKKFSKEFESDDNFLLIAIENKPTVFDSVFLEQVYQLSIELKSLPFITKLQSLPLMEAPIKTPFGYTTLPYIHIDAPDLYEKDKAQILRDERFVNNLIDSAATALVIAAKTIPEIDIEASRQLTNVVDSLIIDHGLKDRSHVLGRAFFQRELIDFQKREMLMAFIVSIILVSIIMVIIYRKPIGIIVSLGSIALGLLLFVGYLGLKGSELNAISALFPVIMLIVGSSDVIHIFSKYVDELKAGLDKNAAMEKTVNEIGLATFMTSFTTAIGFFSLSTSKLVTVQNFGIDAAIGVMIAYLTVIFFTTAVLSIFDKDQIILMHQKQNGWNKILEYIYQVAVYKRKWVFTIAGLSVLIFLFGTTLISTNYNIEDNLPVGARVTQDFKFFEKNFAGFRPLEFAIQAKGENKANEFEVLTEVNKLEEKIKTTGVIKSSISLATIYKSINKMNHGNHDSAYVFPTTKEAFLSSKKLLDKDVSKETNVLLSNDKTKTRISARISDIGSDSIKVLGKTLDLWVNHNLDTNLISVKRTGTGLILDKNSEYVTKNLLQGLVLSILIISMLMGFLFRSFRMLVLALIPNVIPLLFAAAIIGFFSIELEAGVAIIFTIVFGIAVDDTIHFLSRYKICLSQGMDTKDAVQQTIKETGKAIIFTSIILFFGFFNMIFSVNPPTFTVGILISVTLLSALISDLFLLPALIIRCMK